MKVTPRDLLNIALVLGPKALLGSEFKIYLGETPMNTLSQKADQLKDAVQKLQDFDAACKKITDDFPLPYDMQCANEAERVPAIRRALIQNITDLGESIAKESRI